MNTPTIERTPVRPASPPAQAQAPRPVRLEVNRTGLWHSVLEFDAGDELAEAAVREAVQLLASVDAAVAFRITTLGVLKSTLVNYSARHGWTVGR